MLAVIPIYLFTLLFVVGPIIYMVILSFSTHGDVKGFDLSFNFDNYKRIFEPVYIETFVQSFKLAFFSTILVVLIGYPVGYFISRLSEKWKKITFFVFMVPFWTSSLMRLLGWVIILRSNGTLDKLLMSIGIIDKPLKLLYTYPSVLIGMVYVLLPFMIFSVYSSAEKLDWSLVEASRDLGASSFQAFMSITLKLTLPGLMSGIVLTFIPSMGLYFVADILGGNKIVLVGSLIQSQINQNNNWAFAAAISVVLMILTSLMIFIYRKLSNVKELEGLI